MATSLGPTTSASQSSAAAASADTAPAVGHHVVVAEHVELGPGHQVEHGVGGGTEPGGARPALDPRLGQHRVDRLADVVPAGVDHQHVQVGVVLGGQRRQQRVAPFARRVVAHHHDDHGARCDGLGFRVHNARRVAPGPGRPADPDRAPV